MSLMLIPGSPYITEKSATISSGTEVNVARSIKPADISLSPVSAMSFSMAFIV